VTSKPTLDTGWWREISRKERFSRSEWVLLGVSASSLIGALVAVVRVFA